MADTPGKISRGRRSSPHQPHERPECHLSGADGLPSIGSSTGHLEELGDTVSGDLLSVVLARADGDASLSEEAKLLVLAALESDNDLADALDTTRTPHPTEGAEPSKPPRP